MFVLPFYFVNFIGAEVGQGSYNQLLMTIKVINDMKKYVSLKIGAGFRLIIHNLIFIN